MKKRIFLACPIGNEGSTERSQSDGLRYVVSNALLQLFGQDGFELIRADTIAEAGRISRQILEELRDSDLVIADLTGLNANVFYEVGIRQAMLKPLVLLAAKDQKLPFDLADHRTLFYDLSVDRLEKVTNDLKVHINNAIKKGVDIFDQDFFGPKANGHSTTPSSNTAVVSDQLLDSLGNILASQRVVGESVNDLSAAVRTIVGELASIQPQRSGSYVFIDGEKPAFSALVAATLRAKSHVRSTRFFSKAILPTQKPYADAIRNRVKGEGGVPQLSHYSRIIAANNSEKLKDIEEYLAQFSGCPFTLYLTRATNNFELVIIDDSEVFIHFHEKGSIIGSTLQIFGGQVAKKFTALFDRLHDPYIHKDIFKIDFKYLVTEDDIKKKREEIRVYFALAGVDKS